MFVPGLSSLPLAYDEAYRVVLRIPVASQNPRSVEDVIREICATCDRLRVPESAIFPGGWMKDPKEGVGLLYVVTRTDQNFYRFALVNTNADCTYHVATYAGDPSTYAGGGVQTQTPPVYRRKLIFAIDNVQREYLVDSAFWFLLYRMLIFPHNSYNYKRLYEYILPCLTQLPLYNHVRPEDPTCPYRPLPVNGDKTGTSFSDVVFAPSNTVGQPRNPRFI
jgi:hypothetical protein